jgi:poly(3-hydroxybutyrate) depolymerase
VSANARRSLRRSAALVVIVIAGCGGAHPAERATHARPQTAGCFRAAGHQYVDNEVAYIPKRLAKHPPLVLAFHGLREPPSVLEQQSALDAVAARFGFVVAYPSAQRAGLRWQLTQREGTADIDYIRSFIDKAVKTVCVDRHRVYLTGFSNGAGFAWRAGCDLADRVAAVAPVSGSYRSQDPCPSSAPPMPTLEIHGRDPWTSTVERLIEDTKRRNGCERAPITNPLERGVTRTRWPGCALERIYNRRIGHEWLTHGAYNTALEIWRFASRFRR